MGKIETLNQMPKSSISQEAKAHRLRGFMKLQPVVSILAPVQKMYELKI